LAIRRFALFADQTAKSLKQHRSYSACSTTLLVVSRGVRCPLLYNPASCAILHTAERKSEDVWMVLPLESKKIEHLKLSMAAIGFSEEACFS
jgi:hypothetical protein